MYAFLSVFLQFRFKCFILMFFLHFSSLLSVIFYGSCYFFSSLKWNIEFVLRMFQTTTRDLFILFFEQYHHDADAFQFVSLLKLFDLCKCVRLFVVPPYLFVYVVIRGRFFSHFFRLSCCFFYFSIYLFLYFLFRNSNIEMRNQTGNTSSSSY